MMIARLPRLFLLLLTLGISLGWADIVRGQPPVTVFAAVSLKNAVDEVAARFEQATGTRTSLTYGGSSALARQILYGAPAQVFISANTAWMDMLQQERLLEPQSRVSLLTNRLVLIGGSGTTISLTVEPGMDLVGALDGGRLAIALIDAVPAGIYGRAALETLGVWQAVRGSIAQTDNVRAALRLVAVGEAPLGIVYATDARADPAVRVLGVFPGDSHPPILYPAARLARDDSDASRAFFAYLTSPEARAVFRRHGFGLPDEEGT